MRVLTFLLILISVTGWVDCRAQKKGQAAVDSLLRELSKAKDDTGKAKLLSALSVNYASVTPDDGIKYGQQALDLATRINWQKGMGEANNALGTVYRTELDFTRALEYYFTALKINENIPYKEGIAAVLKNIGASFNEQSNFPKALEYYFKELEMDQQTGNRLAMAIVTGNIGLAYYNISDYTNAMQYDLKAIQISEEIGDKYGIATVTWNIGDMYERQARYPMAVNNYFKALKIFEELGSKKDISDILGHIGTVFEDEDDTSKAMEYYSKALQMSESLGDKNVIALTSQNIGIAYARHNEYEKALEYMGRSLKLFEENKDKNGILSVTQNIGSVYGLQHNYTEAIEFLQTSMQMAEEVGDKSQVAPALINIGSTFLDLYKDSSVTKGRIAVTDDLLLGMYKANGSIPEEKAARLLKAIEYLQKGVAVAKEINIADVAEVGCLYLADAYNLKGDYKQSLEYYKDYTAIKDSVFTSANAEKIARIGAENEYEKKAVEAQKTADVKLLRQRTYTYAGLAGILLLGCFSFFIVRERRKSENERKKSDDLLLNILPAEVASELKKTGSTTAKHYDNVTVLFTDFVNFTIAGEHMNPQSLIDELHTCFKKFDEITAKYKIEKIKTIGDAYLAVAGLPKEDPHHAENSVSAAIEINAFMQDRVAKLGERTFQIRIGIHSGSVVAGIVGVKKFAYDIWGDTVNTAARMEQNSEPGKVNISETTYELVKDKFTCAYRGEIEAKNKGQLKMYFVS
jgi:adenylate cyclase